jgi:hypothetical protein
MASRHTVREYFEGGAKTSFLDVEPEGLRLTDCHDETGKDAEFLPFQRMESYDTASVIGR